MRRLLRESEDKDALARATEVLRIVGPTSRRAAAVQKSHAQYDFRVSFFLADAFVLVVNGRCVGRSGRHTCLRRTARVANASAPHVARGWPSESPDLTKAHRKKIR
jgi:hypothetical protein